ncbi:MAG: hypothetical protein GXZ08_02085, partial [Tissierellia bacterium]|nr:hypothetical protein [Tissierellia bacterium]
MAYTNVSNNLKSIECPYCNVTIAPKVIESEQISDDGFQADFVSVYN